MEYYTAKMRKLLWAIRAFRFMSSENRCKILHVICYLLCKKRERIAYVCINEHKKDKEGSIDSDCRVWGRTGQMGDRSTRKIEI